MAVSLCYLGFERVFDECLCHRSESKGFFAVGRSNQSSFIKFEFHFRV